MLRPLLGLGFLLSASSASAEEWRIPDLPLGTTIDSARETLKKAGFEHASNNKPLLKRCTKRTHDACKTWSEIWSCNRKDVCISVWSHPDLDHTYSLTVYYLVRDEKITDETRVIGFKAEKMVD